MPELPEIVVYQEALERHILGRPLEKVRLRSPSLLRTWDPPFSTVEGRRVESIRRVGKRLVIGVEGGIFLVFHLMISGRFKWRKKGIAVPARGAHAAFDF